MLDEYDLSLAETLSSVVGGEITRIKPHLTKKGDPMAFVNLRSKKQVYDLVIFDDRYKNLKVKGIYLFKLHRTIIKDIALAKLKPPV